VLTALVVDPSRDARRRVGALLRLGGWQVVEATNAPQALLIAATRDLDLVVTEVALPGQTGLTLLSTLRSNGSRARFLVVTRHATDRIRAAAASVGALGCLAKPLDPRSLIDFLRTRATAPAAARPRHLRVVRDGEDPQPEVDAGTMDRLHEMFVSALPHRFALIAESARAGDAMAVAAAAQTLGGAGGQLGHPEIAAVCHDIAAEARRGVVSRTRLLELQALSLQATRTLAPVAGVAAAGA
jgi:CheY-like chemotaxis protein